MNDVYTVRSIVGGYRVVKFDSLLNVISIYEVYGFLAGRLNCNCFQSMKHTCRHRQIVVQFESTRRTNRGWFLNWDTGQWSLPVTPEFQDIKRRRAR